MESDQICFTGYVLIETLWNVNEKRERKVENAGYGINRNIVECKLRWVRMVGITGRCINRNIVECKFPQSCHSSRSGHSINRNIVECKFFC